MHGPTRSDAGLRKSQPSRAPQAGEQRQTQIPPHPVGSALGWKEELQLEDPRPGSWALLGALLMRWTKLEPIIQSEVSQKDKEHYNILTHIYGI